jgi:hypothetical protein
MLAADLGIQTELRNYTMGYVDPIVATANVPQTRVASNSQAVSEELFGHPTCARGGHNAQQRRLAASRP